MSEHQSTTLILTPEQRTKLDKLQKHGSIELERIKQIRTALNDDIAALAKEFGVKPKHIRKSVSLAHKANFADHQEEYEIVQVLLESTGRTIESN